MRCVASRDFFSLVEIPDPSPKVVPSVSTKAEMIYIYIYFSPFFFVVVSFPTTLHQPASQDSASPEMVAQARAAGKALFDAEVEAWTARKGKHATSDDKWVEQARHE